MSLLLSVLVMSIIALSTASLGPTPAPEFKATGVPTAHVTSAPTIGTPAPTPSPTSSPTEAASYGNIIASLQNLVTEAQTEILSINGTENTFYQALEAANTKLSDAVIEEGQLRIALETASTLKNTRAGEWAACQTTHTTEINRLSEEHTIFEHIVQTLSNLISGASLVEKEKKVMQALISTEDQADPVKVNQIISLLNKLITDNEAEAQKVEQDKVDCEAKYIEAVDAYDEAFAAHVVAVNQVTDNQKTRDEAQAAHDSYQTWADQRRDVLTDEMKQFTEIIELIKPFFE